MPSPRLTGCGQRAGDELPVAAAGIGLARGDELVERLLIQRAAPRLVRRRLVREQPTGSELFKKGLVGASNAARRVDIFNADEPTASVRTGIEPAGQRGNQRARMQRTGRRGRKSASIGPEIHLASPSKNRQRHFQPRHEAVLDPMPQAPVAAGANA